VLFVQELVIRWLPHNIDGNLGVSHVHTLELDICDGSTQQIHYRTVKMFRNYVEVEGSKMVGFEDNLKRYTVEILICQKFQSPMEMQVGDKNLRRTNASFKSPTWGEPVMNGAKKNQLRVLTHLLDTHEKYMLFR
jgi:hypothetical protein